MAPSLDDCSLPELSRDRILPEPDLPATAGLLAEGRQLAQVATAGTCPFLTTYGVRSESEYKRRRMATGQVMFHAQFGYRSPAKSRQAYAEIHERLAAAGYRVDRYGICLDWSMGYPATERTDMPHGTGLILDSPEAFVTLTRQAPVAPHFGDFCIGMPAAVGAAGVYSRVAPYLASVRHLETGLLADNVPDAWAAAIERLVHDAVLRERLAPAAQVELYASRTLAHPAVAPTATPASASTA